MCLFTVIMYFVEFSTFSGFFCPDRFLFFIHMIYSTGYGGLFGLFGMVRHQSTSPNSANAVLTLVYVLVPAAISVYLALTCVSVIRLSP